MTITRVLPLLAACAASAALFILPAQAQEAVATKAAAPAEAKVSKDRGPDTFAAPLLLMAGEKEMGGNRLYPSPVMHDVDGDGIKEIVIGDLPGRLTFNKKTEKGWSEPADLKGADGKGVKFHNW